MESCILKIWILFLFTLQKKPYVRGENLYKLQPNEQVIGTIEKKFKYLDVEISGFGDADTTK